jgi:ribosomal protein S18 acetylase RimI-like enzyme
MEFAMIRPTRPEDMTALIALADAVGLFPPEQLDSLSDMLSDYFNDNRNGDNRNGDRFWLIDDDDNDGAVGVAYCEPERMTDQTWNLQLIAIHPDRQGQGRGASLLRSVEQTLLARGGRMLLVETSGVPDFEPTRAFYRKCGYEEEARIRDFYAAGDDKVVFRKVLNNGSALVAG